MNRSSPPGRVSIIVAEATPMGCQLLRDALKRSRMGLEVIECVCTSEALVDFVNRQHPDVALISAELGDGSTAGLAALRQLRGNGVNTAAIILMNDHDRELMLSAFRSGAKGVIVRSETLAMLCKCIRSVHEGQIWATSNEMRQILDELSATVSVRVFGSQGKELLTPRQSQLVGLVTEGLSNREISQRLHLSEHTVKNYLFRIFDRLGVSSRAELIIYVLSRQHPAT